MLKKKTPSLCPTCNPVLEADIIEMGGQVWLERIYPVHNRSSENQGITYGETNMGPDIMVNRSSEIQEGKMTGSAVNRHGIMRICMFLLVLCTAVFPAAFALPDSTVIPADNSPLAQDNPEMISALRTHVAYVGQEQVARMDCVIAYIDTISGGSGIANLQNIQEDYLTTASSISVMKSADEIMESRQELSLLSKLFADETKIQIVMFNGSTDDMKESITSSMRTVDGPISNFKDSLWLAKDTARLTVFYKYSRERTALLRSINRQGIDISGAQDISDQIDAQRSVLQDALIDNSSGALKTVNSGLKLLNRQFRATVQDYRTEMQIQAKSAAMMAMMD